MIYSIVLESPSLKGVFLPKGISPVSKFLPLNIRYQGRIEERKKKAKDRNEMTIIVPWLRFLKTKGKIITIPSVSMLLGNNAIEAKSSPTTMSVNPIILIPPDDRPRSRFFIKSKKSLIPILSPCN